MLIITYTICILSALTWMAMYNNYQLNTISSGIMAVSWFVTAMYGTYVFSQKMYQVSELHCDSNEERNDCNKRKLLDMASKFISLLSFAILTTIMTFIIAGPLFQYVKLRENAMGNIFMNIYAQSMYAVMSMDCAVNITCLYLQYTFNDRYYDKYCKCFGNFWLCLFKRKAINDITEMMEVGDRKGSRARMTVNVLNLVPTKSNAAAQTPGSPESAATSLDDGDVGFRKGEMIGMEIREFNSVAAMSGDETDKGKDYDSGVEIKYDGGRNQKQGGQELKGQVEEVEEKDERRTDAAFGKYESTRL